MISTDRSRDIVRHNLRLYFAFLFLMDFGLWYGVWMKYLIEVRGLELRWILAMDLPFWLLVAGLQIPAGALADRIGRGRVLLASALVFSFVLLGFGFTTNYLLLFFDYVLWSVSASLRGGTDAALLFDTLKAGGRVSEFSRMMGRGTAVRLGAGISGVLLGSLVADWIGLARTAQASAIAPALAALVALAFREPPIEREQRNYIEGLRSAVRLAWGHHQIRYTLLVASVMLVGTFGPVVLVQPFLLRHHVPTTLYGVYQAPLRVFSVGAALGAYWIARRAGTGSSLAVSAVVIVVCYLGLAGIDATIAFAFFALPAAVSGLIDPIVSTHLNERIPSDRRATVLSVLPLLFALQAAVFEPALGFFADGLGLRTAFLFAAVYFGVLMPPLLVLWRRARTPR